MSAALTLMAKPRSGPDIAAQVLFCPVTEADFDTASYHRFAEGYHLRRDAMRWFWDQYTSDPSQREEITASPLRATLEELADLPPALVITAEADVLRDEGEAYAAKLRQAGVAVTATLLAALGVGERRFISGDGVAERRPREVVGRQRRAEIFEQRGDGERLHRAFFQWDQPDSVSSGCASACAIERYALRLKTSPTWLPVTSTQSASGTIEFSQRTTPSCFE